MVRQNRPDRGFLLGGAGVSRIGFLDMAPDVDADRHNQQPQDERHAPAPGIERLFGQRRGQQQPQRRAQQGGDSLADRLPADEEPALVGAGRFQQQRRGGADFPARRESLQ
ncbi:hypothetical protein D9M69_655350 [compost metagenome]